jgi:hypothetical protein
MTASSLVTVVRGGWQTLHTSQGKKDFGHESRSHEPATVAERVSIAHHDRINEVGVIDGRQRGAQKLEVVL